MTWPLPAKASGVQRVHRASRGNIADLHTLYLDAASRTSVNLQRVLLAEFLNVRPREVPRPAGEHPTELREGEGALLIGDPAIDFRVAWGDRCQYFDLGEEWQRATGLPFVFAAWLARPDLPEPEALADRLREWRAEGQRRIDEVVADERRYPLGLTRAYLTERIRFRLGAPEKQAIREFARLLHKHGLADAAALAEPRWI